MQNCVFQESKTGKNVEKIYQWAFKELLKAGRERLWVLNTIDEVR